MIDPNLSHLSDLAFEGAMAGYIVALVCHAIEAASRRAKISAGLSDVSASADQAAAELVMAGGSAASAGAGPAKIRSATVAPSLDDGASAARHTGVAHRIGTAAVALTAVGLAFQITSLVLRGLAANRWPWGNMYEFTLMITGAALASWLVLLWRHPSTRSIGVYVMTPITVLVFLAGTVLYTQSGPVVPILNTYWLNVHVIAISLSSGVLMLSGLAAFAYLMRLRHDAKVVAGVLTGARVETRLPSADKLDRIAYRSAIMGFPVFTFAIIAGALWAEVAWGSYWSWDPKEVVALASWVVYAGYLHARATAGWRGKPAAWISVIGLATIIFNLFFVNMVVSGLHSYAGLN